MISKNDLLKFLKENMDKEERGIPLYTQHLANAMFLSGEKKEDQKRVTEVLLRLKRDSEEHRRLYEQMIARVSQEAADVY